METSARELFRVERRLREARGYSEGYAKLLHHSARKVLAANGLRLPDEERPIPIDAESVEAQILRFTDVPASGRSPRSSTATNYAENWRRFARWTRDYLRAESAGEEDVYLHKLGARAPKRSRRSMPDSLGSVFALSAAPMMSMSMPEPPLSLEVDELVSLDAMDDRFAYPAARDESEDNRHVVTVRTSFGPYRMELPRNLQAEDAARIARAVLRLID